MVFLALALVAGLFIIICAILDRSKRSAHHGGILIDNSTRTTNIALHLTV